MDFVTLYTTTRRECVRTFYELCIILMLYYASQTFVLMVIDGLMTHDYKTCLTNQKGMVDFVAIIYWLILDFGFFFSDHGFI